MFTGGMFTTWRDRLLLDLAAPDPGAVRHTESATSTAEAATPRMPYPDGPADPGSHPAPATSFEQDARDAAGAEDRLLDTLADHITRGASPLRAAQTLFGDDRG